jgi:hypothetical protein
MTRCKFKCNAITLYETNKYVTFHPVHTGSEENKSFAKYTPGGKLELSIDPATQAYDSFTVGKEYYIDIQEA